MIFCFLAVESKELGKKRLSAQRIEDYSARYDKILRLGLKEIPELLTTVQPKRGKKKQHKAKNLWDRLSNYKESVLLFMYDFDVPFTNNLPEQDIRMCKVKNKVGS